ncbi:Calmodulin-binding receptor-like cytoplasmic kinase 2 [Hibiscus syriacus]|uniref:Calmodulin-binding receptor-like cytoplasmic kinase 2 n=1 Tax=Hibiscus syriacus TaxID=106335 RepID=A0A6A2Y2X2_HIBSY|nr:Calmodulin-binding receptor-like cytoplasmic kinase 2 [Hibiscus syriacus]
MTSSHGRNPSFGVGLTPDPFAYSATSTYSESSVSRKSAQGYKKFGISDEFKSPSVAPKISRTDGERRGLNRVIYSNSTKEKVPGSMKFTMEEILKATRNFSPAFRIGQGGFGTVLREGLMMEPLLLLNVLKSVYDKHLGVEFQSEITTLAQVEHLHLVKFYGYLEHGDERIVVVEYVPNGTLREHLDGVHGKVLDVSARLDIAIDVAHAITYLHMYTDHPIIHRDIKSSNILLTEKLRAKVTDFGFARLAADIDSGATHVSTQVKGTAGYLDPEQATYRTERELRERITAKWTMEMFNDGAAIAALDPSLQLTTGTNLAIEKILELALQCLAPRRHNRPSMRKCGEILWSIRKDYRETIGNGLRSYSSNSREVVQSEECK